MVTSINDLERRIASALDIAAEFTVDGDHHKMWVIDQMVRALTGDDYEMWVRKDGPNTYSWDEGVAP
jgi:hypothetical protein